MKPKIEERIDEDELGKKFIAEICYCLNCNKPTVEVYYGFKKDGYDEDWDDFKYLVEDPLFFDPDDDFQIRIEMVSCGDVVSFCPDEIGIVLKNTDIIKNILRTTRFKNYINDDYSHYFCCKDCFRRWLISKINKMKITGLR